MSKTYTNEEILERLKSLEGLLLERVFETSYSESLRTYDLIDYLRSKALGWRERTPTPPSFGT